MTLHKQTLLRTTTVVLLAGSLTISTAFVLNRDAAFGEANASSESSQTSEGAGGCDLVDQAVVCGIGVWSTSSTNSVSSVPESSLPVDATTTLPYHLEWIPADQFFSNDPDDNLEYFCVNGVQDSLPSGSPVPSGATTAYVVLEIDNTTGAQLAQWASCGTNDIETTLPPPTQEEAWDATEVLLPLPEIRFSPVHDGLVHLQTWFWLANDIAGQNIIVSAMAGGQTISAVVYPTSYAWDVDVPGAPLVYSKSAGTESDPSAVYTYDDTGTYSVSVTIQWSGYFITSGGIRTDFENSSIIHGSAPYTVLQIRSVLSAAS